MTAGDTDLAEAGDTEAAPPPTRRHRGPVRLLLLGLGSLSLVLGVAGIFLPLVPTTPLLLLAAWSFARSSDRVHRWLLEHRWLGPYIRTYREGRGMTARAKASTLLVLWLAIGSSAGLLVPVTWVRVLLVGIAVGVTLYLLRLPTATATTHTPRLTDEARSRRRPVPG